jgi:hypothetical protein
MTFEEAIVAHAAEIDETLSQGRVPLKRRPLIAAQFFVEHGIQEIDGDTKDNYVVKPWFAIIYHHIEQWYRDQYGAAFETDDENILSGVVLVRNVPVLIRVPATTRRVEKPGRTAWFTFRINVGGEEEPLSWLVAPPNVARLTDDERAGITTAVCEVATTLRMINVYLRMTPPDPADDIIRGFLRGVVATLETAAQHIQRDDPKQWGSALWELQMAIERVLKALSQQQRGIFRETHDLFTLFDDVVLQSDRNLLKKLPRSREVMNERYGLASPGRIEEVIDAYIAALSIVTAAARAFKRRLNVTAGGEGSAF